MKRYIPRLFVSVLTVLLLCCGVSAAAEEEYVNRLTGVAVAEGYELVLLDEQDNTVTQTTDTVNSVKTDVYKNVVKMKLTINDATAREYVVMLLDGGTKVPGDANIRYIDQKSGPGALEFLVYPDQMTQPGDYTLMVFSGGTQSEAASFSVTEEPVQMFSLYNANMELGNSLTMYFYLRQADIQVDKDYYVTIAKTYADGRADVVKIIPEEDWISTTDGGVPVYRVGFEGIAAKEMADDLKVQVFTTDGRQASSLLTYNIRTYAMTMLYYFPSGELATLFVDMLNYGAAAQTFFKYNTDDLANAQLTTAQQALATQSVNPVNNRVVGPMYYNVSLQLESNILLQMYFSGIAPGMYARVSYTDHYGKQKTAEVTFEDFVHYSGDIYYINVEGLAVADGRQLVTCELYNENNVLVGRGTDSVESYIATMNIVAPDALYTQIMKFIDSAYRYFH